MGSVFSKSDWLGNLIEQVAFSTELRLGWVVEDKVSQGWLGGSEWKELEDVFSVVKGTMGWLGDSELIELVAVFT